MKVSTRGDYAARALLSLALHGSDRPTSVKEIAERTGLPQPYLEQILLAVKGAGLVRSKRGVGGGYVLARPPDEITLADILAAVDGPLTTLHRRARPLRGPLRPAGGVGRRVRRDPPDPRAASRSQDLVERTRVGHPDARRQPTLAQVGGGRRELTRARGARRGARRSGVIRTTTSSPPRRRRLERDVAAVADDELAHDRRARGRSDRSGDRRAAPRPTARSGRTRGRAPRASCPGPRRSPAARPSRRARRRRRAPRSRRARPRARCSAGCRPPARADPASRDATGATVDTRRRCARASRPRTRPTRRTDRRRTSSTATGDRRRRRLLGAREHEQAVDEARQARHLGERALEVFGGGAVARRPRGSRAAAAARRAACAAGATRRRRTPAARRRAARGAPRSR